MTDLRGKVYGCLIGGAIGDAMGAPVEGWSYRRIESEFGRVDEFLPAVKGTADRTPGVMSDDSILRHYLAIAIVRNGGRISPREYAAVLRDHIRSEWLWTTEEIALMKLQAHMNPWRSGEGAIPGIGAAMAIPPVGIVNAGNPEQAYQDGYNIAGVTQSGVHRDAAAMIAAGIAAAFSEGADVESVVKTMLALGSETIYRACDLGVELAESSATVDEFTERFYEQRLDWRWPPVKWDTKEYHAGRIFSASSVEILPAVLGLLRMGAESSGEYVLNGINFGRDCDTIASLVGSIVGAIEGPDGFRGAWIRECEAANVATFADIEDEFDAGMNADFAAVTDGLIDALEGERDRARARARDLERLLDETNR